MRVGRTATRLLERLRDRQVELLELASDLVRIPSINPPGDTRAIASALGARLELLGGVEVDYVAAEAPAVNVVARVRGRGPGRRLVFNGHLDTFPLGDESRWTVDPFGGRVVDGKLYGRGVSDMKAGLACSLMAFSLLCEERNHWDGEAVLTFVADEESQKGLGTPHVLSSVPYAQGDAMISADAGNPRVIYFGEKGVVWLKLEARGRAAHGAHAHLGSSAIDAIREAMDRLAALRGLRVEMPQRIALAVAEAKAVSEPLSGAGESESLSRVTVNFGTMHGGTAPNLVADRAEAVADIRLPAGVTVAAIKERVASALDPIAGIQYRFPVAIDPHWTDPDDEFVRLVQRSASEALGERAVVNMRLGATDSRFYRVRGIPTVVCGLTPYGMGAHDEFVLAEELPAVARIHTMAAFGYLKPATGGGDDQ